MNKSQENFISSVKKLRDYLILKIAVVSTIPVFKISVDKLSGLITRTEDVDKGRKTTTSGTGEIVANAKQVAAWAIFHIANILFTYADEENKVELRARVDKQEYEFARMRDESLIEEGQEIIKLAETNAADLVPHGLEANDLADTKTAVEAYSKSIADSGTKGTQSVGETKSVYELIAEMKKLLTNQLDRHAKKFAEKNPDFYDGYKYNRPVVNLGVRHKSEAAAPPAASTTTPGV